MARSGGMMILPSPPPPTSSWPRSQKNCRRKRERERERGKKREFAFCVLSSAGGDRLLLFVSLLSWWIALVRPLFFALSIYGSSRPAVTIFHGTSRQYYVESEICPVTLSCFFFLWVCVWRHWQKDAKTQSSLFFPHSERNKYFGEGNALFFLSPSYFGMQLPTPKNLQIYGSDKSELHG